MSKKGIVKVQMMDAISYRGDEVIYMVFVIHAKHMKDAVMR